MSNTPNKAEIEALVKRHGATSYRNRADTQHPAYGLTEDGLNGLIDEVLAKWGTPQPAAKEPSKAYAWVYVNKYGVEALPASKYWCTAMVSRHGGSMFPLYTAPQPTPAPLSESEYKRGYRDGYERRDAEVRGALV